MCVIIHVEAKKSVSWKQLEACYNGNRDGWGIMWARDGKLHTVKEVSSFSAFGNVWKDVPRDVERAIHFRIKTHGEINKANCHPFLAAENIGFMHNGFIDTYMIDARMSDTYNFVEHELKPVIAAWPNFMDDPTFVDLLEKVTGWSKLLLMDATGKVVRVRDRSWTEKNGIYFSNSNTLSYSSYKSGNYDSGWWDRNKHNYKSHDRNYDNYYSELDEDMTQFKSDLYSCNKTDEEGQKYIEEKEEEAKEVGKELVSVQDKEDTEEDELPYILEMEQLLAMSNEDKLDWVQDCPKGTVYVLNALLDTLSQAGVYDIDYKTSNIVIDQKEAVNG